MSRSQPSQTSATSGADGDGRLARPHYFARQVVTADDLNAGQKYLLDRLRQHNRLVHGCGVICGLLVEVVVRDQEPEPALRVLRGAAIDGRGNEIDVPENLEHRLEDLRFLVSTAAGRSEGTWPPSELDPCLDCDPADRRVFLALCHRETPICPRPVVEDPCAGELGCRPARLCDGWELVLLDRIEDTDCVDRDRPVEDPAWTGHYWAVDAFDGIPEFPDREADMIRQDPVLDFDWGAGGPGGGLADDHFLVRWTRRVYFPAGHQAFTATSDDGVRVRVGGRTVIDAWHGQSATEHSGEVLLSAGVHTVVMEYFERRGQAVARLTWQPRANGWHGEYYGFTGDDPPELDVLGRPRRQLDTPRPIGPGDLASVDVGIAVAAPPGLLAGTIGAADLRAAAPVVVADPGLFDPAAPVDLVGVDGVVVQPVPRPGLARTPAFVRIDPGVALELDPDTSPFSDRLAPDRFVVRWERTVEIGCAGLYELTATVDGGMRVWVDDGDVPAIDRWQVGTRRKATARVMLDAGKHRVRVAYFKLTGRATAKLTWCRIGPYNPPCHEPRDPGCVVLAALDVRGGRLREAESFAFDPARGLSRAIVPTGATACGCGKAGCTCHDGPVVTQLVPGRVDRGTSVNGLVFGHRLSGTTAVRFSGTGVVAQVLPGGTDTWVPIRISVSGSAARNARSFEVTTPACTFGSGGIRLNVIGAGGGFDLPSDFTFTDFRPSIFLPTDLVFTSFQPTDFGPSDFVATSFIPTDFGPSDFVATSFQPTDFGPSDFVATSFLPSGFGPLVASVFIPPVAPAPGFGLVQPVGPERPAPADIVLDPAIAPPLIELFDGDAARADALRADGITTTIALANAPAIRVAAVLGITEVRAMDLVARAIAAARVVPVADTPIVDAPVADTPVIPVADTPIVDAPVADTPVIPVADAPVADAPVADAPVAETPVVDDPVLGDPVLGDPVSGDPVTFQRVPGIGRVLGGRLVSAGIADAAVLASTPIARVVEVLGVSPTRARTLIGNARRALRGSKS